MGYVRSLNDNVACLNSAVLRQHKVETKGHGSPDNVKCIFIYTYIYTYKNVFTICYCLLPCVLAHLHYWYSRNFELFKYSNWQRRSKSVGSKLLPFREDSFSEVAWCTRMRILNHKTFASSPPPPSPIVKHDGETNTYTQSS